MKKWLFTLLAGYAAGLAIAMKYRKDAGTSKLAKDTSKSNLDSIIEEVVDIHKTAFSDAKKFITSELSDVHDFDTLKSKVESYIESGTTQVDELIASLKDSGEDERETIKSKIETIFSSNKALLEAARAKGETLTDSTFDKIKEWLDATSSKVDKAEQKIKKSLEK